MVSLGEELEGHAAAAVAGTGDKPHGLERLEMLAAVRERVEDVVRVFGEAMDWSLEPEAAGKKAAKDPAGEVLYLLASEDLEAASAKVEALKSLVGVFEGTVEGPPRAAVVEKLQEKVAAARAKAGKKDEKPVVMVVVERRVEEKKEDGRKEEGGYYGLIDQLRGLRGIS